MDVSVGYFFKSNVVGTLNELLCLLFFLASIKENVKV